MPNNDPFRTLRSFEPSKGTSASYYSLPSLEEQGVGAIARLPFSIRVVLESVLRNCDGRKVHEKDVRALASWNAKAPAPEEIPFVVARIVLQDFTGVPLLVDLAAMRSAVARLGGEPRIIEPLVPSIWSWITPCRSITTARPTRCSSTWTWSSSATANVTNSSNGDSRRSKISASFLRASASSIRSTLNISPRACFVTERRSVYYPDSLVGTDSHTTMINGLGVVGWGVGGIEAEAGMLGQPVYFLTPEVVGVHLTGRLREGVTATDLALGVTQMLRAQRSSENSSNSTARGRIAPARPIAPPSPTWPPNTVRPWVSFPSTSKRSLISA